MLNVWANHTTQAIDMKLTRHSIKDGEQLYKGPDDKIYDGAGKLVDLQETPITVTIDKSEAIPQGE